MLVFVCTLYRIGTCRGLDAVLPGSIAVCVCSHGAFDVRMFALALDKRLPQQGEHFSVSLHMLCTLQCWWGSGPKWDKANLSRSWRISHRIFFIFRQVWSGFLRAWERKRKRRPNYRCICTDAPCKGLVNMQQWLVIGFLVKTCGFKFAHCACTTVEMHVYQVVACILMWCSYAVVGHFTSMNLCFQLT